MTWSKPSPTGRATQSHGREAGSPTDDGLHWRDIGHMKTKADPTVEKRVSRTLGGGSKRHDDPPAWLDVTLPLEQRRELLDRAIRELRLLNKSAMVRKRTRK